jgi:hypothetical protein
MRMAVSVLMHCLSHHYSTIMFVAVKFCGYLRYVIEYGIVQMDVMKLIVELNRMIIYEKHLIVNQMNNIVFN